MRAHMEQLTQSDYVVPLGGESTHLGVGLPTTTAGSQLDERTRLREKTSTLFGKRHNMNPQKLKRLLEDFQRLLSLEADVGARLEHENIILRENLSGEFTDRTCLNKASRYY